MASTSYSNGSLGNPPKLSRDNFSIWKNRMEAFLIGIDSSLLETIQDGPHVPMMIIPAVPATDNTPGTPERFMKKDRDLWSDEDKKKVALDGKARAIIIMSLPDDIYHSVINCSTAKEMWDTLIILFEGTYEVKRNRRSLLIQQYEMFTSKSGESISEIYDRFNCLINDLKSHGTEYENEDVLLKFLRSLPSEWDGLTIAIRQARNLQLMTLAALYGNLLTHELELQQRKNQTKESRNKPLALVSSEVVQPVSLKAVQKEESDEEEEDEGGSWEEFQDELNESMAMLVKKYKRFSKKPGMRQGIFSRTFPKRNEREKYSKSKMVCFNCEKLCHFA